MTRSPIELFWTAKNRLCGTCGVKTPECPDMFEMHLSIFPPSSGQDLMKQRRGQSVLGFIAMNWRDMVHSW